MKLKFQKGVTLIELILVIAIISIITVFAVFSGTTLGEQVRFASAYRSVEGMLSEARNRSLSGESYPDYSDYDGDGLSEAQGDLILPYGYIVNFHTDADGIITVSLYADLLRIESIAGQLETDADDLIKTITLPDDIEFDLTAQDKFGVAETISDPNDFSVLYKTPDAAFELIDYNPTTLQIEIKQVNDSGELKRSKYLFLHYLYGIPEVLSDPFI